MSEALKEVADIFGLSLTRTSDKGKKQTLQEIRVSAESIEAFYKDVEENPSDNRKITIH